jgi:hypothetical protein
MPQSMLFVLLSNLILLKQWASPDKIASSPQKTRVTSACLAAIIAFEKLVVTVSLLNESPCS